MLPDFVQRFESKRQVVEAVQLTADADWEAIAEWCSGMVGSIEWINHDAAKRILLGHGPAAYVAHEGGWIAHEGVWIVLSEGKCYVLTDEDFRDEFSPVPYLEGVAGEIRQALEGTTPGPWEWVEDGESMWLESGDGTDVIRADQYEWLNMTQADGELVAAAPDLLARAADRIEQLEAWKESATRILGAWDEVWVALGQPGPLGTSKAAASLAAIAKEGA